MKLTPALLLTTSCALAIPHPSNRNPSICSPLSTVYLYIGDLNSYPIQSDIYQAQAQALILDKGLQCPTSHGILRPGEPASDACRKNQELKDRIAELVYSSAEDKRLRVKGLMAACEELAEMVGCVGP